IKVPLMLWPSTSPCDGAGSGTSKNPKKNGGRQTGTTPSVVVALDVTCCRIRQIAATSGFWICRRVVPLRVCIGRERNTIHLAARGPASGLAAFGPIHGGIEPGAGIPPGPIGAGGRNVQAGCRLGQRQASEKTQLDQLGLFRVVSGQLFKGLVQV